MNNQQTVTTHFTPAGNRPLKIALTLVVVIMVLEFVGGILSNSLALIGDAGHMLVDTLALSLSLFAMRIAQRPATSRKTYGYRRAEIMAALTNGSILVLLSAFIFYEAYQRLFNPPQVDIPPMLSIAAIGLIANLAGMLLLRRARRANLNIRAAFWHIFGDTISSVGVIIAGIIILFTGWYIADPAIAVVIGGIILWGAVQIIRESSDILLESVPKHIQVDKVIESIKSTPGVQDVHDIHIWTITSGLYALSAHLLIDDQKISRSAEILESVNRHLAQRFDIKHTTLQLECENCTAGFSCAICPPEQESSK
jgi:cobalt-zinc-cadmium efflux system protein